MFDHNKLRDDVVKIFGEHGAHADVLDELIKRALQNNDDFALLNAVARQAITVGAMVTIPPDLFVMIEQRVQKGR